MIVNWMTSRDGGKKYRENYDAIFRKNKLPEVAEADVQRVKNICQADAEQQAQNLKKRMRREYDRLSGLENI
jgi:hypothetical protein